MASVHELALVAAPDAAPLAVRHVRGVKLNMVLDPEGACVRACVLSRAC